MQLGRKEPNLAFFDKKVGYQVGLFTFSLLFK